MAFCPSVVHHIFSSTRQSSSDIVLRTSIPIITFLNIRLSTRMNPSSINIHNILAFASIIWHDYFYIYTFP